MQLVYDAIITVSGDGLVHEVLNGFAHHAEPMKAFATPVAPIPTGSGNALSINLLGIEVSEIVMSLYSFSLKIGRIRCLCGRAECSQRFAYEGRLIFIQPGRKTCHIFYVSGPRPDG